MRSFSNRGQRSVALFCGAMLAAGLAVCPVRAADYGRLSGTVRDTEGNPLMGATVLVMGPLFPGTASEEPVVERVLTDANGKFLLGDLMPGWYSLRVFSPTRLPASRDRIRVAAGETAEEGFVLGDIFAPLRIQIPKAKVSSWGDEWKWILRTSASTRPVLRFQDVAQTGSKPPQQPLPPSQRLIGVMPGSSRGDALAGNPGMGSVLAYFRPLSEDSDVLVAGSMTADGLQASTLTTAFRRNLMRGDPQELSLTVHQLSFADGAPYGRHDGQGSFSHAQAVVISYTHTRRVTEAISVTTGFEVDYLAAASSAMTTRPNAEVEYRLSPDSSLSFSYGGTRPHDSADLMDRIGDLNAFPRVTSRNFRPRLERLSHSEVSYDRNLGKRTRIQVATYHDGIENAALWGAGDAEAFSQLAQAGNFLPNPADAGVTLNAGDFSSSGLRVALVRALGSNAEAVFMYSTGESLAINEDRPATLNADRVLRNSLRSQSAQSFGGRLSARVPRSHTRIITSYQWLPRGSVTGIDPVGEATMDIQPFLNVQIRQPLPTLDFFSAHVEAMADFRNLLAEGYVPIASSEDRVLLTPAYRSFRGGFSVQF
jgi:Carboxypeptidase regulatory-like domain